MKYIFVAGGVMSGVGKGVAAASIGRIIKSRGFEVTAIKIDPYINVDAGTMNPTEHGEVFVLNDGTECDQDMGNYERFLAKELSGKNYMTTGSIYLSVISRERNLEYGGKCVEVVPHIPLEVIDRIDKAGKIAKADVVIVEIGGTVGEYQNVLFLEAVRILKIKHPKDVALVLVSFLPQQHDGELKTKPTQSAVRIINSNGLQPDMILARASVPIDKKRKEKIAFMCNLQEQDVISAPDVETIYEVPVNFEKDNLSGVILKKLGLKPRKQDLADFRKIASVAKNATKPVKIGIVGKYFNTGNFVLADSYISVIEAVKHASFHFNRKPEISWLNSESFENNSAELKKLSKFDGIIVPGGFGSRGIEGKIAVIEYCRKHKIPYFGLCYGMQLAVVEFARNVAGMKNANTVEIDLNTKYPVVDIMSEQREALKNKNYGGSMRLGAYPAKIKKGTIAFSAYKNNEISERHRHRYEINPEFISILEKKGLIFSGVSPSRTLMEIAELPKKVHPFFIGTQFHPELKSWPTKPHPLFVEFIKAAIKKTK